jgi:hypothetical protein
MSECGVCIGGDFDYDGTIEMYDCRKIVARKEHLCRECKRTIPAKSICERASGKWDGKFFADYVCMDCVNIRDGLSCDGAPPAGTLWESIQEVFGEINTGCLSKIETASAKAFLVEKWNEWKFRKAS